MSPQAQANHLARAQAATKYEGRGLDWPQRDPVEHRATRTPGGPPTDTSTLLTEAEGLRDTGTRSSPVRPTLTPHPQPHPAQINKPVSHYQHRKLCPPTHKGGPEAQQAVRPFRSARPRTGGRAGAAAPLPKASGGSWPTLRAPCQLSFPPEHSLLKTRDSWTMPQEAANSTS